MNNYKIIIVSNNDDISFFKKFKNKIIYNMGFPIDDIFNIEIPCSYTYVYGYLYHIIKNYDSIDYDIIFCNYDSIGIVNKFIKSKKKFKYNETKTYLNNSKYLGLLLSKNISKSKYKFEEWFNKYLGLFPSDFKYINTNIIKVSKKIIKSKPKSFYIDIFKSIYNLNEESFFLEKAIYYLFFS